MDPKKIPKRSDLWFGKVSHVYFGGKLLDRVTISFSLFLIVFAIFVFWPVISKVSFVEAFDTPFVPFLIQIFKVLNIDANGSLRILFILSLAISGLGIYLLVRDIAKRQVTAILASVIYFIPAVPIFILTLFPGGQLDHWLISAGSFFSIIYGDGAHFLALAAVPYGAIVLLRYLRNGSLIDLVLCVCVSSLVLLISRSQALGYFLILALFFLTEVFLGTARLKLRRFLKVIFFSFGVVSFWYTPLFWVEGLVAVSGQIIENIKFLFPLPFIVTLISLLFSYAFFGKRVERQAIFASFLTFIVFMALLWSWLYSGHAVVLHPARYIPNLVMFGAIVTALALSSFFDKLNLVGKMSFEKFPSFVRVLGAVMFGLVSFVLFSTVVYLIFPLFIMVVSSPNGELSTIKANIAASREEVISAAGGNFRLIANSASDWQLLLGYTISAIFIISLIFLIINNLLLKNERLGTDDS